VAPLSGGYTQRRSTRAAPEVKRIAGQKQINGLIAYGDGRSYAVSHHFDGL